MKRFLPFLLFTLVAHPLTGQESTAPARPGIPVPTHANVSYGSHERQVLDFWRASSDNPTPLLFFIHGGGWVRGDKSSVGGAVQECLKAGISVASINYRYTWQAQKAGVMPPVEWPVRDAARALQFVRSKASEWNIDKTRIGASGGSAGACSSLWLAFHKDLADPASTDPVAQQSTRLWCAAVDGAQTSLDPAELKEWTPNSRYGGHAFGFMDPENLGTRDTRFTEFLQHRKDVLKHIQEYSPLALATKDAPPIYLKYGDAPALGQDQKDPTHTANYGVKLQEKLRELGVECELVHADAHSPAHPSTVRYIIEKLKAPAPR
jgi:acetyl esterase/lipase